MLEDILDQKSGTDSLQKRQRQADDDKNYECLLRLLRSREKIKK